MKLSAFMRGKVSLQGNLTFVFYHIFFFIVLFSPSVNTSNKTLFSCFLVLPPHLRPGLHPSLSAELSADTVYTLNKVKTAVTKQSGLFDKNI